MLYICTPCTYISCFSLAPISYTILILIQYLVCAPCHVVKIRSAAVGVLTRRELATDEIAAAACGLLEDEDPRLRREVLGRLGRLMKESR